MRGAAHVRHNVAGTTIPARFFYTDGRNAAQPLSASNGRPADYFFWRHVKFEHPEFDPAMDGTVISLFLSHFAEEPVIFDLMLPWGEVVTHPDAKLNNWAEFEFMLFINVLIPRPLAAGSFVYFANHKSEYFMKYPG